MIKIQTDPKTLNHRKQAKGTNYQTEIQDASKWLIKYYKVLL